MQNVGDTNHQEASPSASYDPSSVTGFANTIQKDSLSNTELPTNSSSPQIISTLSSEYTPESSQSNGKTLNTLPMDKTLAASPSSQTRSDQHDETNNLASSTNQNQSNLSQTNTDAPAFLKPAGPLLHLQPTPAPGLFDSISMPPTPMNYNFNHHASPGQPFVGRLTGESMGNGLFVNPGEAVSQTHMNNLHNNTGLISTSSTSSSISTASTASTITAISSAYPSRAPGYLAQPNLNPNPNPNPNLHFVFNKGSTNYDGTNNSAMPSQSSGYSHSTTSSAAPTPLTTPSSFANTRTAPNTQNLSFPTINEHEQPTDEDESTPSVVSPSNDAPSYQAPKPVAKQPSVQPSALARQSLPTLSTNTMTMPQTAPSSATPHGPHSSDTFGHNNPPSSSPLSSLSALSALSTLSALSDQSSIPTGQHVVSQTHQTQGGSPDDNTALGATSTSISASATIAPSTASVNSSPMMNSTSLTTTGTPMATGTVGNSQSTQQGNVLNGNSKPIPTSGTGSSVSVSHPQPQPQPQPQSQSQPAAPLTQAPMKPSHSQNMSHSSQTSQVALNTPNASNTQNTPNATGFVKTPGSMSSSSTTSKATGSTATTTSGLPTATPAATPSGASNASMTQPSQSQKMRTILNNIPFSKTPYDTSKRYSVYDLLAGRVFETPLELRKPPSVFVLGGPDGLTPTGVQLPVTITATSSPTAQSAANRDSIVTTSSTLSSSSVTSVSAPAPAATPEDAQVLQATTAESVVSSSPSGLDSVISPSTTSKTVSSTASISYASKASHTEHTPVSVSRPNLEADDNLMEKVDPISLKSPDNFDHSQSTSISTHSVQPGMNTQVQTQTQMDGKRGIASPQSTRSSRALGDINPADLQHGQNENDYLKSSSLTTGFPTGSINFSESTSGDVVVSQSNLNPEDPEADPNLTSHFEDPSEPLQVGTLAPLVSAPKGSTDSKDVISQNVNVLDVKTKTSSYTFSSDYSSVLANIFSFIAPRELCYACVHVSKHFYSCVREAMRLSPVLSLDGLWALLNHRHIPDTMALARKYQSCVEVRFSFCNIITDNFVLDLFKKIFTTGLARNRLQSVSFYYCYRLTDDFLIYFLNMFPKIRCLDLGLCYKFTDDVLVALSKAPLLEELALRGNFKYTADAIHEVLLASPEKSFVSLKKLDVVDCCPDLFPEDILATLKQLRPQLTIIATKRKEKKEAVLVA